MASGQASMVPGPAAAIVAGGAFGALFDPLDHRGTSSHMQDNHGAMEALQGAI